jgi:DNA polymerase-3 subunit gamma/tau
MRDALSMFDMVSTFSPDRAVTYQQVITNLHILDSDYYFKITRFILEGNNSGLLLTFDEILQKGFDGHLFILGLAEHFRDILLASDPATHGLLEVGEGVAAQYLEQSGMASPGFFLNLLNMASQAELQYKNSKNARLLVELCLLKMANLRHALEAVAEKKKSEQGLKEEAQSFKIPEQASPAREKNRLERASFRETPSIKKPVQQTLLPVQPEGNAGESPGAPQEKKKLSPVNLSEAKEEYVNWLKNEQIQNVSAWKLAATEETEGLQVYLTFTNEIAQENFEKELMHIKRFFNIFYENQPHFETLVSEKAAENLRPYTNAEKFAFLAKRYPALSELRTRLGLEID